MKKLIFGVLFVSILFTTVSCGNNQNTKQAEWVNDEILTQLNADPVFPAYNFGVRSLAYDNLVKDKFTLKKNLKNSLVYEEN